MFSRNLKFKTIWSAMLTLTLLVAPFAVQAQGTASLAPLLSAANAQVVPGQYIVVYKSNILVANAEDTIRSSVAAQGGQVQFVYGTALNGYSAKMPAKLLASVRADPNVAYVEADGIITVDPDPDALNSNTSQYNPDWGLDRIDQHDLPLNNKYSYVKNGSGVNAYIIDTGIRSTHHDFGGRATKDYDAIGDGRNGNDCAGHGTHVAGTIGGTTYGVAKAVRLHGVRVLNCQGSGTYSQVIAGVNWVALHRVLPAVANMSLGGPVSTALDSAVNGLISHGVTVVVAAGNSSANACSYSPSRVANAITVGSTYYDDARSYFSNIGVCLDIFAPGSYVKSAWYTSDTATNTISGTSMASPHVAGVVALYLQGHHTATPASVRAFIVSISTLSKVTDPGAGSPNRLLFSRFTGN